jgi:hypothetical protein
LYALPADNSVTIATNIHFLNGHGTLTVEDPGNNLTVNANTKTVTWTKQASESFSEATRDFTFTFAVDNDSVSLDLHIGYAEVQFAFAGGEFAYRSTAGGATASNTVVVGQKVAAKVVYDSAFTPVTANNHFGVPITYTWSTPSGGSFVKDYVTSASSGDIIYHDTSDYNAEIFTSYYISKTANTGGISCSFVLRDPHGAIHNAQASAAYYLETPTSVSLSLARTGSRIIITENIIRLRPIR